MLGMLGLEASMALDIALLEPGFSLGRNGQTLEVRKDGVVQDSIPLHRLASLSVGPGTGLSSDLLAALADQGVPLLCLDRAERPAAILQSPHGWGGAPLRRSQARSLDNGCAFSVAQALIGAKIRNQGRLQRLWAGYLPQGESRERLQALSQTLGGMSEEVWQQTDRPGLMILEAHASRLHWGGVSLMIPFRERRYPRAPDLSNQLLNYGYAVLGRVWLVTALRAGLDPNLGVLHADRIGRPGLVLDLLEPWRPWVDRVVVGLIRQTTPFASAQGELTLDSRHRLLDGLHRAFRAVPARQSHTLLALWLNNTRQLARHLHEGAPWQPLPFHP